MDFQGRTQKFVEGRKNAFFANFKEQSRRRPFLEINILGAISGTYLLPLPV